MVRAITLTLILGVLCGGTQIYETKQLVEDNRMVELAFTQEKVCNGPSAQLATEVERYRSLLYSKDLQAYSGAALALRKWMIANDPFRPIYHFTGPESWINDPNGPIYFKGQYHLFYQYKPFIDGRPGITCWGHAVSKDLLHWVDWPVAIWPDTPRDSAGVYSGNTFIDDNGNLCAMYTGNVGGHEETYGILACSTDEFLTCTKKVVMDNSQRPNAKSPVHWDGFLWREGKTWCQLIGGCTEAQGAAWLWKSSDLQKWTLQKNIAPALHDCEFWELPYLIPLGEKYVLMIGQEYNPYWIGTYNPGTMLFTPDVLKPRRMDRGDYYSFNPNMVDDKGPGGAPRRIMHGWAITDKTPATTVPYWQNAHSIPRVLTLKDGRVWQEPIPEISILRAEHQSFRNIEVTQETGDLLKTVRGDALEIIATFRPGTSKRFGINVRSSADNPGVQVWYDEWELTFGAGQRSTSTDLKTEDLVTMHIFVDRCLVEVYVNGNAITVSSFHNPAAQGVTLFSDGGKCTLETLEVWRMKSMWD